MPFFSIIIPIYNTNRVLLEKCFDSIKKQIFVDYEIIVINDCSVNIETIAFIKNLINVKIINNVDNLGLAMSRNIGINYSNGQYIVFCDSDDYLSPDALDIMHHYIKHIPNLDILSYEVVFCKNDALYKPKNGRTNTLYHKLTNFELQPVIIQNRVPVWSHCYHKNFLIDNNIFFNDAKKFGEDLYFHILSFAKAKKIYSIPEEIYVYREYVNDSITSKTISENKIDDALYFLMEACNELLKNSNMDIMCIKIIYTFFYDNYILLLVKNIKEHYWFDSINQKYKDFLNKNFN